MTEPTDLILTTWASADGALLRTAIRALEAAGVAASPVVRVEWNGTTSFAVALNSRAPLAAPPVGVRVEATPAAGVFMQGPRKPTPLEWMDRLPPDRQTALLEALDANPQTRAAKARLLAAQEIDVSSAETQRGVAMLRQVGVLTDEEAATLLA